MAKGRLLMTGEYFENEKFENLSITDKCFNECEFVDCQFVNCSIQNCKISRCTFSECRFVKCSIDRLESKDSEVRFIELESCCFTGIDWGALLPAGRFSEPLTKIENCSLKYNTFSEMSLVNFVFTGSNIIGSLFAECKLSESCFNQCDLSRTEFYRCDLRKADFQGAKGYKIDVLNNQLKGAKFSYPEALNLLQCLDIVIE